MYMFKSVDIGVGEHLLRENEDTDSLYIIETGILEVYIELDGGNKFEVEFLKEGSVLNYRSLFTEDFMLVNVRAIKPAHLRVLSEDDLNKLCKKDKVLNKKMQQYQHKLMKNNETYPVDAICHTHSKHMQGVLRRRIILKNTVTNIIQNNRIRARKPKLTEILKMFGNKYLSYEEKGSIANKLRSIYDNKEVVKKGDDLKFEKIMDYLLRLNKVFRINMETTTHL
jgi:CRP-like cAMP-binding protein